jgi:hypothetical protein
MAEKEDEVRETLKRVVLELRDVGDPAERVLEAAGLQDELRDAMAEVARERHVAAAAAIILHGLPAAARIAEVEPSRLAELGRGAA